MSVDDIVYDITDGEEEVETPPVSVSPIPTVTPMVQSAPSFVHHRDNAKISSHQHRDDFCHSLNAGTMLAKSLKTGEVKTINVESATVIRNPVSLSQFEVRDNRVVPKYNFTKADPGAVNIYAHKGPDEPKPSDGGVAI